MPVLSKRSGSRVGESGARCLGQGWQTILEKGFVGHAISPVTPQLCPCGARAAADHVPYEFQGFLLFLKNAIGILVGIALNL